MSLSQLNKKLCKGVEEVEEDQDREVYAHDRRFKKTSDKFK